MVEQARQGVARRCDAYEKNGCSECLRKGLLEEEGKPARRGAESLEHPEDLDEKGARRRA